MNPVPAANIQAAAFAGVVMSVIEHYMAAYGHPLPPDIAPPVAAFVTVIVGHVWDMATGGNKPKDQDPPDAAH
jgi:hypothetical protein